MALCHEYGIPHSQFMEWDPADRDLAISFVEYKSSVCQKCGTRPEEWLDEEGKLLEPLPYQAHSVKCHGCATLEEARARVDDKAQASTINHSLRKIPKQMAERIHRKWQMNRSA